MNFSIIELAEREENLRSQQLNGDEESRAFHQNNSFKEYYSIIKKK
jgi:hypothetical protein